MYATRVSALVTTAARAPAGATNAYLVAGGGNTPLVDPAACIDRLDGLVAREGIDYLVVIRTHTDRVGAVATYARETGATVWCRYGRERVFSATTGVDLGRVFAEGTTVPVGAGVEVLDMPGYTHDYVSSAAGDNVFCSGLTVAEGSVVVDASKGDARAYLVALRRLHTCGPERLRPGHDPEITDPRVTLTRLVARRDDRERAVLDVVHAGNAMPDVVVDATYDKNVSAVRDLACAAAVTHTEKLAVGWRVRWDPEAERVEPR